MITEGSVASIILLMFSGENCGSTGTIVALQRRVAK